MKKPLFSHFLVGSMILVVVILTGLAWAVQAANGGYTAYIPVQRQSLVLPPADEASARLTVPPGFAIRIFAQSIAGTPRFMDVGPDNRIYVSLYSSGQIARLPDRNGDGLADAVEIVAGGLNLPHGLEWRSGWLYVAENDKISRLRDSNGAGLLNQREVITTNLPSGGGHATRTLHFGPDGKLYVSAGSSCNICIETDPRRAAILRFNPDGSIPADNPFVGDADPRRQAVWATGLRNSVDFLWTPSGQLWADHNGRDGLVDTGGSADNLPPEEIIIPVQKGLDHGWPYCYTPLLGVNLPTQPEIADTQLLSGMTPKTNTQCAQLVPALFTDLAHSAPLGMTLGDGLRFPNPYPGDLFVAYHGSWNTSSSSYRDCKVRRILLQNGIPTGAQNFVSGWRAPGQPCGAAQTWGRPADVIAGPDGAMYISDDKAGRVYRLVFTGQ